MRPLELTIEGLRSFRAPVTLDLRGRDQIAIVGDTGAGKSSIIEAIVYALYGQPTFSGLNRELMNDTAARLRVGLRFRVAGEEWEVVRTLRRSRTGTVGQAAAQLRRFAPNGDLLELVEQARAVNDRIESVIGLNRDAFLRTTVLPQGRFAQLLVEDDPRVRSMILRQVWRTDELEAAGEVAAAARQDIAALRVRIEQAASRYPDDPTEYLAQLREQAEQARRAADIVTATEREAADAFEALRAAEAELVRVRKAVERLGTFDPSEAVAKLEPLAAVADEIDGRESALRERQDEVANRLSVIPADDDGPSVAQVAAALTTLDGIPRFAEEAATAATELQARTATVQDRRTAAERAAAEGRRAADAVAAHEALAAPLEQALQAAERRRDQMAALHTAALETVRAANEIREEWAGHERNRQDVAEALRVAAAEAERRSQDALRAREHLAAARRSESAVLIAGGLHPGDECPICRRALAPEWHAPAGADLSAAEHEAEAADAAAARARDSEVALDTRRDAAAEAVRQAEERLGFASEDAATARRTLADAAAAHHTGPAPPIAVDPAVPLPDAESFLAPLDAAVAAADWAASQHAERRQVLEHDAARQEMAAKVAGEAAARAEELLTVADQAAGAARSRLREAVASVPEPYRPPLELPAVPLDPWESEAGLIRDRVAAARQREQVLMERQRERDRLGIGLRELATEQAALRERRSAEVDDPLGDIVRSLNDHRDVIARSAVELDMEPDVPDVLTAASHEMVAGSIDQLGRTTEDMLRGARDRDARATAERDGGRQKLHAVDRRSGADGIGDDEPGAIVARARGAAESARYEARSAYDSAEKFAAMVDQVAELRGLLGQIRDRERALSDLEAALKDGAFPKWLTLRRSRSLLVHASRTLEQISGGRYAFVEPDDELDRWRVLDRDSGQPRSPVSLSGGEQFITSLALALGMVEMMARSGGSLESLFLDEGFGALDRTNLDAAIEALTMVATGGRMVVLISHVQAVAEQVANVAAVTRTPAGSRIAWLSDAQRRHLVESEAGSTGLGGLLE